VHLNSLTGDRSIASTFEFAVLSRLLRERGLHSGLDHDAEFGMIEVALLD
jgi:hypothetical protein